jgi:hypothetical protein
VNGENFLKEVSPLKLLGAGSCLSANYGHGAGALSKTSSLERMLGGFFGYSFFYYFH